MSAESPVVHDVAEQRLVERMRAGEHAAFETVIRQYHSELQRYAAWLLGAATLADDVLQELFLSLWKNRSTLQIRQGLRGYLYSAVRNRVHNYQRGQRRLAYAVSRYETDVLDASATDIFEIDTTDDADAQMVAQAKRAIEALPPRAREAWHLHHDQGLTYAEVAEVMGVSVGTVKSQMARAVALIRAAIEPMLVLMVLMHR